LSLQSAKETSVDVTSAKANSSENSSLDLETGLRCPECNSKISFFAITCSNCASSELKSGKALEHLSCGHCGFEEDFKSPDGRILCPHCKKSSQGLSTDFVSQGESFLCVECSTFLEEPRFLFSCPSCGYSTSKDAKHPSFDAWMKRSRRGPGVPNSLLLSGSNLAPLVSKIKSRNWTATPFKSLIGKSGVKQEFSLVISNSHPVGMSQSGPLVVVDLLSNTRPITQTQLLSFFGKTLDIGVKNKILVAVPKLEIDAKRFADSYGIVTMEAATSDLALEMLYNKICEIIDKRGAEVPKPSNPKTRKRTSFDILADILKIAERPISKTEILYRANLSFKQAEKYLKMLEDMGLLKMYFEDGNNRRYLTTQKGKEYLSNSFKQFGRIPSGSLSVWSSKEI
jgi:predicted transcriptional regulator/DNA-directed RNA polymerase subunit RPC12/RpoP